MRGGGGDSWEEVNKGSVWERKRCKEVRGVRSLYLARARAPRVHLITPGLYSRVLQEKCGGWEESGEE